MSRPLVIALVGFVACLFAVALVGLAACGGTPRALESVAAEALECSRDAISIDSYDRGEGNATAICGNRGVYLERAGDQWLVMQSFPIDPVQ